MAYCKSNDLYDIPMRITNSKRGFEESLLQWKFEYNFTLIKLALAQVSL